MALTTAVLQGGVALGTTPAALYTVPAGKTAWVRRAVFANTSTSVAVSVAISVTRAGGSPITLALLIVAAGQTYISPELASLALNAGDAINASAGTSGLVNVVISGLVS